MKKKTHTGTKKASPLSEVQQELINQISGTFHSLTMAISIPLLSKLIKKNLSGMYRNPNIGIFKNDDGQSFAPIVYVAEYYNLGLADIQRIGYEIARLPDSKKNNQVMFLQSPGEPESYQEELNRMERNIFVLEKLNYTLSYVQAQYRAALLSSHANDWNKVEAILKQNKSKGIDFEAQALEIQKEIIGVIQTLAEAKNTKLH